MQSTEATRLLPKPRVLNLTQALLTKLTRGQILSKRGSTKGLSSGKCLFRPQLKDSGGVPGLGLRVAVGCPGSVTVTLLASSEEERADRRDEPKSFSEVLLSQFEGLACHHGHKF